MPGLKAFGRLWSVASDDFVCPAALEIIMNCSWLLAVSVIYMTHDITRTCLGGRTLETYVLGCCILLLLALPLLVLLAMCSSRGAVMEPRRRRHVTPLLYGRLVVLLVSLGWDILGSVWLSADIRNCDVTLPTVQVIIGLVACNWLRFLIIVAGVAVVFDPLGSVSLRSGGYSAACRRRSALRRSLWQKRFRLLCCCLYADDTAEALRDVATHMATLIGEVDLVPSDVVAGLILLQQRHALVFRAPAPEVAASSHGRPAWMSAARASHYMRFALGVYGWPWFVHGRVTSSVAKLCRRITCCASCRSKAVPSIGDNCCLCNTAALQECTLLEDRDLLYVSFVNKLYQVAFTVALDHRAESVVVAIRGTLSVTDALTDLCLDSALICGPDAPEDRAHKGMLESAKYVMQTLEKSDVLSTAAGQFPDYDLVITGHSLGAGAAALLALLLRPAYPHLKCFAFSPPGGLVSRSVSEVMQEFVMSVVCGDDLVPRLSVASVEWLKYELQEVLFQCRLSKHTLLYKACCNCACGAGHDLVTPDENDSSESGHERPLVDSSQPCNYESLADAAERAQAADLRALHAPLYLPGHVLHVRAGGSAADSAEWRSIDDFARIHVSVRMFADHLPDYVSATLREVADLWPGDQPQARRWLDLVKVEGERWTQGDAEASGGEDRPLFSSC